MKSGFKTTSKCPNNCIKAINKWIYCPICGEKLEKNTTKTKAQVNREILEELYKNKPPELTKEELTFLNKNEDLYDYNIDICYICPKCNRIVPETDIHLHYSYLHDVHMGTINKNLRENGNLDLIYGKLVKVNEVYTQEQIIDIRNQVSILKEKQKKFELWKSEIKQVKKILGMKLT